MRRTVTAVLAAFSLLAPVAAGARDAKVEAEMRARVDSELSCDDKTPELAGACLRDKFKTIRVLQQRFQQELKDETKRWHLANDKLGISAEYQNKLRLFLKDVAERRSAYAAAVREKQRELETLRQNIAATSRDSQSIDRARTAVRSGPSRAACRRLPKDQARECYAQVRNPLDKE